MKFRYQQQLSELSCALFILKELCFRLETWVHYPNDYQKQMVYKSLSVWNNQYQLIKDIKVRWWDFGDKRELLNQIKIYKATARSFFSKEAAKEYNLL